MPIAEIDIVLRHGEEVPETLARSIAVEVGEALQIRDGGLWVRIVGIRNGRYAENSREPSTPAPVFVHWLESERPANVHQITMIRAITGIVARLTHRPEENVHIVFEASARGRVSFGGQLLE